MARILRGYPLRAAPVYFGQMKGRSTHRFLLLAAACFSLAAPHPALAQAKPPPATIAQQPRGIYATTDMRPAREMIPRLTWTNGSVRRPPMPERRKGPW